MRFLSPLRYPGGKSFLAPFLGEALEKVPQKLSTFVEPFAGGAGAALRLLVDEYIERITINDINRGIVELWRGVFERTDEFVERINQADVTVDEWRRQKEMYGSKSTTDGDIGFATFFLNRTNRSGILGARPIGGLNQDGAWKIDARFNKAELTERIRFIARYRSRVEVRHGDGLRLLRDNSSPETWFVYADPPYLKKSQDLYLDECDWDTHVGVANQLTNRYPYWMVSYDDDDRVSAKLYPKNDAARFSLSHTASSQRFGTEIAVFSQKVAPLVDLEELGRSGALVDRDSA